MEAGLKHASKYIGLKNFTLVSEIFSAELHIGFKLFFF